NRRSSRRRRERRRRTLRRGRLVGGRVWGSRDTKGFGRREKPHVSRIRGEHGAPVRGWIEARCGRLVAAAEGWAIVGGAGRVVGVVRVVAVARGGATERRLVAALAVVDLALVFQAGEAALN